MDTVADLRLGEFSDVLASKAPVPGGGGASAVAAAVGASLGQMVASLTLGKKKYADVQGRIEELIPRFEAVRADLLALADEDAKAFEPLSRAYGLPRSTEEERAAQGRGHGGCASVCLRAAAQDHGEDLRGY
jgi:formiminotetrahydrofolate cyclodeaminase